MLPPMRVRAAIVIAAVVAATVRPGAESLVAPRMIGARLEGLVADRVDLSVTMALRATRDLTLRGLSFTNSYVDDVPVRIEPLEGRWTLEAYEELRLPEPVRVHVYTADLVRLTRLTDLLTRGAITVRSTVEMSVATPWPMRLLRPWQVAVADVVFDVRIEPSSERIGPLLYGGAVLASALGGLALPALTGLRHRLSTQTALLDRYGPGVAIVNTIYDIEGRGTIRRPRTVQSLAFWWTPETLCTTREAMEPWRFAIRDATLLSQAGARVPLDTLMIELNASGRRVRLDAAHLIPRLPRVEGRTIYTAVDDVPARIRMLQRKAGPNVVCLTGIAAGSAFAAHVTGGAPSHAAMFVHEGSLGLRWTAAAAASGGVIPLTVPATASSFGSPLVSDAGVLGIVISSDAALVPSAVAAAARRAIPVKVLQDSRES